MLNWLFGGSKGQTRPQVDMHQVYSETYFPAIVSEGGFYVVLFISIVSLIIEFVTDSHGSYATFFEQYHVIQKTCEAVIKGTCMNPTYVHEQGFNYWAIPFSWLLGLIGIIIPFVDMFRKTSGHYPKHSKVQTDAKLHGNNAAVESPVSPYRLWHHISAKGMWFFLILNFAMDVWGFVLWLQPTPDQLPFALATSSALSFILIFCAYPIFLVAFHMRDHSRDVKKRDIIEQQHGKVIGITPVEEKRGLPMGAGAKDKDDAVTGTFRTMPGKMEDLQPIKRGA